MDNSELISAARDVRRQAYAPYSQFAVGAALLTASGEIFVGCNVENVSFGLTICAERAAIGCAIANGQTDFAAIAVVTDSASPALPCGACRQVLSEFTPTVKIIAATLAGDAQEFSLQELLPRNDQGLPKHRGNV